LEEGKSSTHTFKLVHGDYSYEDRLMEEQANKDMIEEQSLDTENSNNSQEK